MLDCSVLLPASPAASQVSACCQHVSYIAAASTLTQLAANCSELLLTLKLTRYQVLVLCSHVVHIASFICWHCRQ